MLGDTNTCAVTQADCALTWGRNGAIEDFLPPGPIDADGVYTGEGMLMGMPVACTMTFATDPRGFDFECTGRGIACAGIGF